MGTEHTAFYILPDDAGHQIWIVPNKNGWTLPSLTWVVPDDENAMLNTGHFNNAFVEHFDIHVTTRFAFHWRDSDAKKVVRIFNLENYSAGKKPSGKGRWVDKESLSQLEFMPAIFRSVMDTWFHEVEEDSAVSVVEPWFCRGWVADVRAWVSDCMVLSDTLSQAAVAQVRFWQRSAVLRVQTSGGCVYFKACPKELRQEIATTDFLAQKIPDRIPNVIASDAGKGWMLTEEIEGVKLDTLSEAEPWCQALTAYAQLQQDALGFLDELTMCADWRPLSMLSAFESLLNRLPSLLDGYPAPLTEREIEGLRAMIPKFESLCQSVEAYGVPCTLEHCDANGDNFWMGSNGLIVTDWAESCITHPFIGVVNFILEDEDFPKVPNVKIQFQNAYLKAWTDFASLPKLRELVQLIPPLKRLQDALHYSKQFEIVLAKLNDSTVLPHSYAKWTLGQVHSWVPHYWRLLLEQGFSGLEVK